MDTRGDALRAAAAALDGSRFPPRSPGAPRLPPERGGRAGRAAGHWQDSLVSTRIRGCRHRLPVPAAAPSAGSGCGNAQGSVGGHRPAALLP